MNAIVLMISVMVSMDSSGLDRSEVYCLSKTIYHEARGVKTQAEKYWVASVVSNRAAYRTLPTKVCDIVYDTNNGRQFSLTYKEVDVAVEHYLERLAWQDSVRIAIEVLSGEISDPTYEAIYFFEKKYLYPKKPKWVSELHPVHTRTDLEHMFFRN